MRVSQKCAIKVTFTYHFSKLFFVVVLAHPCSVVQQLNKRWKQ